MNKPRPKFWALSEELLKYCNDQELAILKRRLNTTMEQSIIKQQKKYLKGEKYKLIE